MGDPRRQHAWDQQSMLQCIEVQLFAFSPEGLGLVKVSDVVNAWAVIAHHLKQAQDSISYSGLR